MPVSSSTEANEPRQAGPTGLLLATFSPNDLLAGIEGVLPPF